jgi:cyclopropane fatty-acyl-phospholipid synthase-like methyltransferase
MTRKTETLPPDYFESLYQADPDPWRFASSPYEQEKYAASLACLTHRRYRSALEIGCSIGVFTRALAKCCDHLLAIDAAQSALAQARATCAGLPVTFERRHIPSEWPTGHFDLIVLSEILYYLAPADLEQTAACVRKALRKGGLVLLVHYLGTTDYPLTGDQAADIFTRASGLSPVATRRAPLYRIDVLEEKP